jgi:cytochrome b561
MNKYPVLTRLLHAINALLVIGLFFSGWYMVDLDYYSPWYQSLPEAHILAGVLLLALWLLTLLRLIKPGSADFPPPRKTIERLLSRLVKLSFYVLISIMVITGYLITTAGGEPVDVFGWLHLPSVSHFSASGIDTMGKIHQYASYALMALVVLHILGALKHHFIDQDDTLKRML